MTSGAAATAPASFKVIAHPYLPQKFRIWQAPSTRKKVDSFPDCWYPRKMKVLKSTSHHPAGYPYLLGILSPSYREGRGKSGSVLHQARCC